MRLARHHQHLLEFHESYRVDPLSIPFEVFFFLHVQLIFLDDHFSAGLQHLLFGDIYCGFYLQYLMKYQAHTDQRCCLEFKRWNYGFYVDKLCQGVLCRVIAFDLLTFLDFLELIYLYRIFLDYHSLF